MNVVKRTGAPPSVARRCVAGFVGALVCAAACATGSGEAGGPAKVDPSDGGGTKEDASDGDPAGFDAGIDRADPGDGAAHALHDAARDAGGDEPSSDGSGSPDVETEGGISDATIPDGVADAATSESGGGDGAAEGAASTCGPCAGCCDPSHPICRSGGTASSCGTQGEVCVDCTLLGEKCVGGECH